MGINDKLIKIGDLVKFTYKNSNPDKARLVYVTDMMGTLVYGQEYSELADEWNPKKFHFTGIQLVEKVKSARLPKEASPYGLDIFATMLGVGKEDVSIYEVNNELLGVISPKPAYLTGYVVYGSNPNEVVVHLENRLESIKLTLTRNSVLDCEGDKLTKEDLITYLQHNL